MKLASMFWLSCTAVALAAPPVVAAGLQKWVQCVAFSPDGQRVVAGNDEGRLWVVDARAGKMVLQMKDVASAPTAVAWSHKGALIAVGGWRRGGSVREAKSGKLLARWPGQKENITSIVLSIDDKYLATGSGDDTAKVWSVRGGEALLVMEKFLNPWALEVMKKHPEISICDLQQFVKDQENDLYQDWR